MRAAFVPQEGGFAQLWTARKDGSDRQLLYAEQGLHIYGGCSSPDNKYLLFTRSAADLGPVDNSQTVMAVIRWSDIPMISDSGKGLPREDFPGAKRGPRLDLGPGWEPHWANADVTPAAKGPSK